MFGGFLHLAPPATLLIVGLVDGLLVAIPVYLFVRALSVFWRLRRKRESLSRKQIVELPALLLGGLSLVTQNPLWFQLEVPILPLIVLAGWIFTRRRPFTDAELPFRAELVGDGPHRILKSLFIAGLLVIPAVLLWLALDTLPTAWLLVRTLAFPLGLAALSILGTWFAARHGERMGG